MRMEPLTKEAIELARKHKLRCIELMMSHPLGEKHKHPKLAVGFSWILPEKVFNRLIKLVTGLATENYRE